jgi:hypothetical protein
MVPPQVLTKGSFKLLIASLVVLAASIVCQSAMAEKAFVGAGSNQCDLINSNAVAGRGSDQNTLTQAVFIWSQGYLSGYNAYSLLIGHGSPFDLEAARPESQWEYIVSYCRTHPTDAIVKAIQDLQIKLLK